ncbi:MAG: photosystem II reaction center protein PsbN [Microcoleaceae cyanobacterium]
MEPAIALNVSIAAVVISITAYAIYISFGPPSTELNDPFEDHED